LAYTHSQKHPLLKQENITMTTIHLDPKDVPATLRGAYAGKKFQAEVCEQVFISSQDGIWDGGSRTTYQMIEAHTSRTIPISDNMSAPWNAARKDQTVKLEPGYIVIAHSIFCGKDMGLKFYVHPSNAAALLPAKTDELTPYEKLVLTATRSLKSSYGGQDRYEMMSSEYRSRSILGELAYPTRAQWDETKTTLIAKGLLNKAGAITVQGRNAVPAY
jgi:hypothetical protein